MRLIPLQGGVSTPIKEFWKAKNFKHGGELTMVNIYICSYWIQRNLFFSNIKPFEEKGLADEWEKVGMYLSGFNKLDDNQFSMEILFEIRTKKCQKVYEDLYKEMTQLLTRDHFRNLFFSNIKSFEEKGLADEWDKVGMYLSGFNKLDDNRFSMKILFEIRKKKCQKVYEDLYKEMTQLLTRDHFREKTCLPQFPAFSPVNFDQSKVNVVNLKKEMEPKEWFGGVWVLGKDKARTSEIV
ncbi:hypothetical protein F2Q70_00044395 [Brassica cretica]|uniref:TPR1-like CTLH-containing domain-containing protein n=1 Tax=Brassica cretica TaxID=69181 RepID=A0A8S9KI63_BRACR|nr:hypothetical protein F2Q70_00044395 [Brassica cretica]